MAESERGSSVPALWASEPSSVNLNRRGQVLKLYRKGKTTAEIAADLKISQGEVDLLVKVHDLGQGPAVWRQRVLSSSFWPDGR